MSDNGALLLGGLILGGLFVGGWVQEYRQDRVWRNTPTRTYTREEVDLKKVREMQWDIENAIRQRRR